ncbi:hypothetical protein E3O19_04590 [Cryobacterium algoritolerans]|uniref:Uncharacterized protein n=1 Tax=Cryobacterium algoritolerans TaxID=1259184 RepID=A0A4V6QH14_9MICO|nr:hypothetical protein [Cryobacterium algoritolerans]TFC18363.1 hypothetical protein E3O19_04590 [Cryobacterium algoritolerans]
MSGHATREEAVDAAFAAVTRDGGWLTVHYSDGAVESHQQFAAAATSHESSSPGPDRPRTLESNVPSLVDERQALAETGDSRLGQELDLLDLLGVVGLVGIPLVSGVYSPEILAAARGETWVLYSVSLTWALGFALVAVAASFGLRQARLGELVSAVLCFALSGYLAGEIGVGGLGAALEQGGSLFESLGSMLTSALHAYGPGGAVATAAIGVFFGWRLARHLPGSMANWRGA